MRCSRHSQIGSQIIVVFLIVQFVAFFGALFFGRLADKVGAKQAIMISLFIWTGIAVAGFLLLLRSA